MVNQEQNWHVFIINDMRNNGIYRSFSVYGERGYNIFLEFARDHEWEIAAYEGKLTDLEMNKITGLRIKESAKNKGYLEEKDIEQIGETHLANLVERLNSQDSQDSQEELEFELELDPYKQLEELRRSL